MSPRRVFTSKPWAREGRGSLERGEIWQTPMAKRDYRRFAEVGVVRSGRAAAAAPGRPTGVWDGAPYRASPINTVIMAPPDFFSKPMNTWLWRPRTVQTAINTTLLRPWTAKATCFHGPAESRRP